MNDQGNYQPVAPAPVFLLDEIRHAGVPIGMQMSPYLHMDPSIFRQSEPQYLLPDGGGKSMYEFAFGRIGYAVVGGFIAGSVRGGVPELFNSNTRQLAWQPWWTRMMNATMKHGSGYAQPAGVIMLTFSGIEVLLSYQRTHDPLSSMLAGTLTGALFRSAHGLRAIGAGSAVGLGMSLLWTLANVDSREQFKHMLHIA